MKKIIISIVFLLFGAMVYCQPCSTPVPSIIDDIFDLHSHGSRNVNNTGNDILAQADNPDNRMHVMVCDGDRPSFVWWDNTHYINTAWTDRIDEVGALNPYIVDPDVVLFETNGTFQAMIVFEVQGTIYYIIKEFDSNTNTWSQSDPFFISEGTNPNIDASTPIGYNTSENKFVVVWEAGNFILTYLDDFTNGLPATFPNSIVPISVYDQTLQQYNGKARTPDATISYIGDGGSYNFWVTYTYLIDDLGQVNSNLVYFQDEYNNIVNNSFTPWFIQLDQYPNVFQIGRPRIASPDVHDYGFFHKGDFEIVIDVRDTHPNGIIWGYNRLQGNITSYLNYEYCSGPHYAETLPVVCYCGDYADINNISSSTENIIVSYDMEQCNFKTYIDVLQITVQNDGVFSNGLYKVVNHDIQFDQKIPSVSGSWQTKMVFYSFYDDVDHKLKGKEVSYSSPQLKKKIVDNQLLYPNPAQDNINIPFEDNGTATIFDVRGVEVGNYKLTNGLNNISLELTPGIYYIEIKKSTSVESRKLIIF